MCGIAGYLGKGDRDILGKMTASLRHRGPDDEGFFVSDGVGLGHRRLSIIDVAGGHQPLGNEDGSIQIVFNGEIYNFGELKKGLGRHRFRTQSDTEVLVHLYEEYGEDFLRYLNGMFAFALWDGKKRKLLLARDRMGQKPLYYSFVKGGLVFGSELRALFEYPSLKKEIDLESLGKYLSYEYLPVPRTLVKGVYKLEPGQVLVYQDGKVNKRFYWNINFGQNGRLDRFGPLLEDSVKKRLISDVPLGIFLSGGIDSSTIAYFAQKNSFKKIKTFSIGFDDPSFDESSYALRVAEFLGTEHHHQNFSSRDLLDSLEDVAFVNDEPLADASLVPTLLLSRFARRKVTVALGGDGGDELMAGYPTFQALKFARLFRLLPRFVRRGIQGVVGLLPVSFDDFSFDFRLKKLLSGYDYSPEIQNQIWLGSFSPSEVGLLLGTDGNFSDLEGLLGRVSGEPLENRLIYLYLKQYLANDILVKTDKASMAASLEVRAPFLDYRLVELVNSLPYDLKLKGLTGKYLLKELMKEVLPHEIVYRRKKGFGIPVGRWIRGDLREFVLDMLGREKIQREGIFDYSYIDVLLKDHFAGKKDNRKLLWTLLMFEMWLGRWG